MPHVYSQVPSSQDTRTWAPGFWQKRISEANIAADFVEMLGYLKDVFSMIQTLAPQAGWIQIPYKSLTQLILPFLNTFLAGRKLNKAQHEHHSTETKAGLALAISGLSFLSSLMYYTFWMVSTYGNKKDNESDTKDLMKIMPYLLAASLALNSLKRLVERLHDDHVYEEKIADLENQLKDKVPKKR